MGTEVHTSQFCLESESESTRSLGSTLQFVQIKNNKLAQRL